tara:strand:- start:991 stop:1413 length:423 start_codon:yes stop_codon:yes gene_type:complete
MSNKNGRRMKQEEIISLLNYEYPQMDTLLPTTNQFAHHDCENDLYIIEIKSRDTHYDPWIIEKMKYDANIKEAESKGKDFIYITEHRLSIIAWNVTDLTKSGYNFMWEVRQMPETTEFEDKEVIHKEVGYLYESFGQRVK